MMNFDPMNLIISMLFSTIGTGFFIYGRKQSRFFTMMTGIALGVFPYFVTNLWLMVLVGVALTAVPFVITE
jgi:hypothetical protein